MDAQLSCRPCLTPLIASFPYKLNDTIIQKSMSISIKPDSSISCYCTFERVVLYTLTRKLCTLKGLCVNGHLNCEQNRLLHVNECVSMEIFLQQSSVCMPSETHQQDIAGGSSGIIVFMTTRPWRSHGLWKMFRGEGKSVVFIFSLWTLAVVELLFNLFFLFIWCTLSDKPPLTSRKVKMPAGRRGNVFCRTYHWRANVFVLVYWGSLLIVPFFCLLSVCHL